MAGLANSPVLSPQLADLRQRLDANSERVKQLIGGLSKTQLIQRPSSGGWSVAECVAHLTLTTKEYLQLAEAALANAPQGHGPFRRDWMGRLVAWSLEPPYKMKSKTPPAYVPKDLDPLAVLPDFLASQEKLKDKLERSEGLALDKIIVNSSFNKHVKYNLLSFFMILAAHQRRHLWQAEQVKKTL